MAIYPQDVPFARIRKPAEEVEFSYKWMEARVTAFPSSGEMFLTPEELPPGTEFRLGPHHISSSLVVVYVRPGDIIHPDYLMREEDKAAFTHFFTDLGVGVFSVSGIQSDCIPGFGHMEMRVVPAQNNLVGVYVKPAEFALYKAGEKERARLKTKEKDKQYLRDMARYWWAFALLCVVFPLFFGGLAAFQAAADRNVGYLSPDPLKAFCFYSVVTLIICVFAIFVGLITKGRFLK